MPLVIKQSCQQWTGLIQYFSLTTNWQSCTHSLQTDNNHHTATLYFPEGLVPPATAVVRVVGILAIVVEVSV